MIFHVSAAERAQSTFRNLQPHWPGLTAEHGVTVAALYTFDYRSLMEWIAQQASDLSDLAVLGHNPALTDLTNYLVGYGTLANIPTAGWVELALDMHDWADIPQFRGGGQLSYRLFPRELPESN
jgi:phosphohistidine phosphatase